MSRCFATKIAAGSTSNKADSRGRRLGLKKWGHYDEIQPGDILARQRGFQWHPGHNVYSGKDHTLHSKVEVRRFLTTFRVHLYGARTAMHTKCLNERMLFLWSCLTEGSQHPLPSCTIPNSSLTWVRTTLSQRISNCAQLTKTCAAKTQLELLLWLTLHSRFMHLWLLNFLRLTKPCTHSRTSLMLIS